MPTAAGKNTRWYKKSRAFTLTFGLMKNCPALTSITSFVHDTENKPLWLKRVFRYLNTVNLKRWTTGHFGYFNRSPQLVQRANACDRTLEHHTTAETIVRRTYSERNENSLRFSRLHHLYTLQKKRTMTLDLQLTSYTWYSLKNLHETQQKLTKC